MIAAGMPKNAATSVPMNAMFATGELSHPHAISEANATACETSASAATNATHLIC